MARHKLTKKELAERRARRHAKRETSTNFANDDQVLNFPQWCALNGFSEPTGKRVLASGDGPPVVWLSARRRGVRVGDNRRWQEARIRSA
jgi:hypothetical protein